VKRSQSCLWAPLKPENKDALTKVLTFRVVPGRLSSRGPEKPIMAACELKNVSGGTLAIDAGQGHRSKDEKGGMLTITIGKGSSSRAESSSW
jgi:uncharacterized surface protein with fasciclin (FAS1) repeats